MKQLISFFAFILLSVSLIAQESVNASDLLKRIDAGESIELRNSVIKGDLRLVDLSNRVLKEKDCTKHGKCNCSKSEKKNNDIVITGSNDHYIATVKVDLKFYNCTFDGKLVAYESEENGPLYTANFEGDFIASGTTFADDFLVKYSDFGGKADFDNVRFRKAALLKYADFQEEANFSGASYKEEANFKYAEFNKGADFSGNQFKANANFKYAHFEKKADFSSCVYSEEAIYKYTKCRTDFNFSNSIFSGYSNFKNVHFDYGVNFSSCVFNRDVNFKNAHFSAPLNLKKAKFNGEVSSKNAMVDGKSFSSYMLNR